MGWWGPGYNQNDTYLDDLPNYLQPLIAALQRELQEVRAGRYRDGSVARDGIPWDGISAVAYLAISDLRGQLIFTFRLLTAPSNVVLERRQVGVLQEAAAFILQ